MKIKLFGAAGRDRTIGADVSDYRTGMCKPLHASQRSEAGAPQFGIRLVHLLRKVKSSTSVRTRCFRRLGGNRLVRVSSAIPWRLAQNSSDITSALELCPGNNSRSWENAKRNSGGVAAAPKGTLLAMPSYF